ncbi:MAG TPA: VanZ family protein [Polyangiaceae bacterium]
MTADAGPQRERSGGFFLHVAPALLYVLAIFYAGSVAQGPELDVSFIAPDKLLHAAAFFGMQLTMFRAVRWKRTELGTAHHALVAFGICCAAGAGLEFWQATLPHRSAEFGDWLADAFGAGAAALLLRAVYGRTAPA